MIFLQVRTNCGSDWYLNVRRVQCPRMIGVLGKNNWCNPKSAGVLIGGKLKLIENENKIKIMTFLHHNSQNYTRNILNIVLNVAVYLCNTHLFPLKAVLFKPRLYLLTWTKHHLHIPVYSVRTERILIVGGKIRPVGTIFNVDYL